MVRTPPRHRLWVGTLGLAAAAALSVALFTGVVAAPGPGKTRGADKAPTSVVEVQPRAALDDPITHTVYFPVVTHYYVVVHPWETEVIDLTNQERAKVGCAPLVYNPRLTAAAQGHSRDMAISDYFSHYSLDGRTPWDRIRATGYDYSRAAENIAAGYGSPSSVVAGWMASSGHRANILDCRLTEIGVGYFYLWPDTGTVNYGHYWTQVFATPAE